MLDLIAYKNTHVPATNPIKNSNFVNGIDGWEAIDGTITAQDGILTYKIDKLSTINSQVLQRGITFGVGKYYVRFSLKAKHVNYTRVLLGSGEYKVLDNPTPNEWTDYKDIYDLKTIGAYAFRLVHYTNIDYEVGEEIYFKDISIINLTEIFGKGNEPTIEQMDALLETRFENGWFDGTKNLFNAKDFTKWISVLDDEKANKKQEEWITPTLINGWERFGTGYSSPSFRKNEFNCVSLRGTLKTSGVNSIIFTLPVGYRPPNTIYAVAPSHSDNTLPLICDIRTNGEVRILNRVSFSFWVSIEGVSFYVE